MKEISVYPDDSIKPDKGDGLNKRAEVTLHRVWPMDNATQEPITDPDYLATINYQEHIKRDTLRIGAKFIDYRSETGSCVFVVEHFSKYKLDPVTNQLSHADQSEYKIASVSNFIHNLGMI